MKPQLTRQEAIEALAHGKEYMHCILSDAKTWLDLVPKNMKREEARDFLLTRIYMELTPEENQNL